MMKASEFLDNLGATVKSCCKIILQSRPVKKIDKAHTKGDSIVILANGPSLRQTIEAHADRLRSMPSLAVNFMANTPEFNKLKPDFYVLADPHFFTGVEWANVESLWQNLAATSWPMTLCVAANRMADARRLLGNAPNITLKGLNFIGLEGFHSFERMAYSLGLGMPRPRNVLIPSIMVAIAAGYRHIYITGADHSWLETLRVNDDNQLVSVQPHFYTDSSKELTRQEKQQKNIHLHDILKDFYIAFNSYHRIKRYATGKGVNIYNSTPASYIDAFERRPIPKAN